MPLQILKVSGTLYQRKTMKTEQQTGFKNHVTSLKEGMKAPDFRVKDERGQVKSLKDYSGKKLILYFYPADSTPTCTDEACNLRDHFEELRKEGYEVLGISKDDERSHLKFIAKYQLPFSLLADTTLEMIRAYDVWGEKKFMGKIFEGVARTTFLISGSGIIEKVLVKVKSKEHSSQILENAT
jgi:peroxiredoxin Q/BCP